MKSVDDLRDLLGQAMRDVSSGKIDVNQARAIAQIGGVICETAKIEIDLANATDGDFKGSGFIDVDPSPRKQSLKMISGV